MNNIFYPEIPNLDSKSKYLVIDSKFGIHPWRFALETYLNLVHSGFNVSYSSFVDLDLFSVLARIRIYMRNFKYQNERNKYSNSFEFEEKKLFRFQKHYFRFSYLATCSTILRGKPINLNLQTAIDSWISTHKGSTNYSNNFFTKLHSIRIAKVYFLTLSRLKRIMLKNHFDVIFTFNGRFPIDSAISEYCRENKIKLFLFDGGSIAHNNYNKIQFFETSPHNNFEVRNKIRNYWDLGEHQKFEIAHKSIFSMIEGERFLNSEMNWEENGFKTNKKTHTYLPEKNMSVIFFASSDWEQGAINRWKPKSGYTNQFDFFADLSKICKEFKLALLLKPHPIKKNVKKKNANKNEFNKWQKFCDQNDLNATIIRSDSGLKTKDLLKHNFIVAGFGTSVLAQSIYLGKPTLVACEEVWITDDNFECYVANENELRSSLFKAINNKSPLATNQRLINSVLPWAYYRSVCGVDMRYTQFVNKSLFVSNIKIDEKRTRIRIR